MLEIRVEHNYKECAERIESLSPRLTQAMREGTARGLRVLDRTAHETIGRRTGKTASTIKREVLLTPDGARGVVFSEDKVAAILEYGSRPHTIRPRPPKKALRFEVDGKTVFAKVVRHPGTRAYRWLQRAGYSSERAIESAYASSVEEVLRS
ncbi:hypothetical protein [Rubrobacter calidifluminis]|uniref:hypothetical protein n=1 Tax=Rubrobacter calidifluminis TaxID=1392640 RepID=UPI00236161B9|nr:hypothetical protein [Rubrobacter calidifluminis]